VNPRTKKAFIWHMFHARGGGGASSAGDGWPTAGEGQAAGGIKFGSVEVTEVRFPLFLKYHEFRPDSGGAGKFRGGVGSVLELCVEVTESARANTAGDGIRHRPYGLFGGQDGLPHRYRLISGGRTRFLKTKEVGILVRPGDVFFIESSGGGGYGDPVKRDPQAHAEDLANGFVTRKGRPARTTRGVGGRLSRRRNPPRADRKQDAGGTR
jgi:N-methylhydantoinase B